jgi:hypothetical protein
MTKKRIASVSMIGLLMGLWLTAMSGQPYAKDGPQSAPSLEGSWNVIVNQGTPAEFRTLITYDEGGGLVASPPLVPPPFHASTVHGTWEKVGGRRFAITFLTLLYDSSGQFVGTVKVRGTLGLNRAGDESDAISTSLDVFDPAGNLLPQFSTCGGTSHGTRIKVEPPDSCS